MNLWLIGALSFVQAGVASVLWRWTRPRPSLRALAAGAGVGLILFYYLPQALQLSSTMILAPSLVLGIILSVFLRQSVGNEAVPIWCLFLSVYLFLQAKGTLPPLSLLYLTPFGIALSSARLSMMLFLPTISFTLGCLLPLSASWQGMLLSVACGMMLECFPHHNDQISAGGIAIGVILSFI